MPLLWISLLCVIGIGLGAELPETWSRQPTLWLLAGTLFFATGLILGGGRVFTIFPKLVRTLASLLPARVLQTILRVQIFIRGRLQYPSSTLFLVAALCLGIWRYQTTHALPAPGDLAGFNDRSGILWAARGVLDQPVDVRDGYVLARIAVESLRVEGHYLSFPVKGMLLARIDNRFNTSDWAFGDRVEVIGDLSTPSDSETFSYRDYLAHKGIFTVMKASESLRLGRGQPTWRNGLHTLRAAAAKIVYDLYPDPEASLLSGILLGLERSIPTSVQHAFNLTGTSHIIAISGFNITILAVALQSLFARAIGRWKGTALAIGGVFLYALLTGAQPSAVRAAWMGAALLIGQQFGRGTQPINSLAFVAALMSLIDSDVLWDSGFQLSFAATLGLAVFSDPMAEILRRRLEGFLSPEVSARIVQPISEYFLATLAAQAAVLPLLFARSAQLSWATLPANILILPAQPLLMILGGLSVLAGLVWEIPAQALAWLAWAFAAYTIRIVEWFAGLPGPSLVGGPTAAGFLLVLFALMFSGWFIWPLSGLRTRLLTWLRPGVLIVGLAALSWVVWSDLGRMPDGYLHLYLLDVNTDSVSGDAVLIKTPDGQFVLLDGGPSVNRLSDALGRRLPLSNRRLDWLVVGGVEEGQLAALPSAILRYPPMQVLWAGGTHASPAGKRLHAALLDADIPRQFAESGQVLEFSEGGRLRVLAAGTRGAIFLLEYGNFRALLPLGPDADMLDELNPETIGRVDAWLLAGNGYAPLNPPSWLNKLTPSVILISVAVADYRSLPDPGLLNQFAGTTLLRTDEHGWVHLQTDGERLWVTVEK